MGFSLRVVHLTSRLRAGIALTILSACSAGIEEASLGVTVRDSAGVQIVEHSAEHIAALPVWTIDSVPLVRIGSEGADSGWSAIADALERFDGRFIVADRRLRDIRQFTAAGVLERRIVGPGQGPGEVGIVQRLQLLPNDSLAYVDPNQRRVSFFTPESSFATQIAFLRFNEGTDIGLIARLDDGRWLGTMRPPFVPTMATGDRVYRTPFAVVVFDVRPAATDSTAAFAVDTIALVPDVEAYAMTTTEEGETRPDEYPLRFGRSTVIASDGRRTRLLDWVLRETDRSGRSPSARAEVRQMISQWRLATTFAFFDKLRVGTDGTLWEEAPWVLTSDARRYGVYDTAGRAIARAEFPAGVTPLRVSATAMLGTRLDEDDVPQLQQWRVRPTR